MKLLVDMNLSPDWVPALIQEGWEAVHWVTVGAHSAPDHEILNWARENEYVLPLYEDVKVATNRIRQD